MAEVFMTCGKICSGKSTYAQKLRNERNAVVLRVDRASNFETISRIMAMAEELHLNMFILARKSDSEKTGFTELEKR